jgi:hypothetical protein
MPCPPWLDLEKKSDSYAQIANLLRERQSRVTYGK